MRRYDVEPELEAVQIGQHFVQFRLAAVDLHVAGFDGLFQGRLLQHDLVQGFTGERDRCNGIIDLAVLCVIENAVHHFNHVFFFGIGEIEIQHDLLAIRFRTVEPHAQIVEEQIQAHGPNSVRARGVGSR